MIKIKLQSNTKTKSYLVRFNNFEFDSILHFIFELFTNNKIENKNIDSAVIQKILNLGYDDVSEIPNKIKNELQKTYHNLIEKHNKNFDEEKQMYLLMDKIVKEEIIVTIDNLLLEDIWCPITINNNSVVSFIDSTKLKNIDFKTI